MYWEQCADCKGLERGVKEEKGPETEREEASVYRYVVVVKSLDPIKKSLRLDSGVLPVLVKDMQFFESWMHNVMIGLSQPLDKMRGWIINEVLWSASLCLA